jgi:hypothetical protein
MSAETAWLVAGLALALLSLAALAPSAWVNARRQLDLLLDAEADEAMAAACDREWLTTSQTPVHDALWVEFLDAALNDDGKGRWTA